MAVHSSERLWAPLSLLGVLIQDGVRQMSEMLLRSEVADALVGQIRTAVCKRALLQQREDWPSDFREDLLASLGGSHDMEANVHVWLQRQKIGHTQDS